MARVILASKSPRRKELLEMLRIPFEIIVSDIEEQIDPENDLTKEIEKLSYQKAKAVFEKENDALVIGSDTIVKINNQVLGKPKTHEEAREKGIKDSVASCTLMAELGGREMHIVPGSEKNIKVTTVEDLEMIKALMHVQKDSWLK